MNLYDVVFTHNGIFGNDQELFVMAGNLSLAEKAVLDKYPAAKVKSISVNKTKFILGEDLNNDK
jgi:hypothetical protein